MNPKLKKFPADQTSEEEPMLADEPETPEEDSMETPQDEQSEGSLAYEDPMSGMMGGKKGEKSYPSITLRGEAAKKLGEQFGVGETVSGNATFKVTGYAERPDDKGGCTLDLEATDFMPSGETAIDEAGPDEADQAFSDYESQNMGGQ